MTVSRARTSPDLDSIARTVKEIPFPKKFAVELCAECNRRSSMCHHPQMRRPKGTMPFELFRKCADEIAATSPRTEVWFSFCGEPLLEPDLLLEMLAYGKAVGLESLNINTNGMLLTPQLADPLLDSGVDLIVIGIDGFSADKYAKIRAGGDRDTLYANVEHVLVARNARGDGPEIQVQSGEMDENEGDLEPFETYWLGRGATLKVRNKLSWGGRIAAPKNAPEDKRIPCPRAVTMMHVFWDGRVTRCPRDTEGEDAAGNAWHEPLADLWQKLGAYRKPVLLSVA